MQNLSEFHAALNSVINGKHSGRRARKNMAVRDMKAAMAELLSMKEAGFVNDREFQQMKRELLAEWKKGQIVDESAPSSGSTSAPSVSSTRVIATSIPVIQPEPEKRKPFGSGVVGGFGSGFGVQQQAAPAEDPLYARPPKDAFGLYMVMHLLMGSRENNYAPELVKRAKRDNKSLYPGQIFNFYGFDEDKAKQFIDGIREQFSDLFYQKVDTRGRSMEGVFGLNTPTYDDARKVLVQGGDSDPAPKKVAAMRDMMLADFIRPGVIEFSVDLFNSMKVEPTAAQPNRGRRRITRRK